MTDTNPNESQEVQRLTARLTEMQKALIWIEANAAMDVFDYAEECEHRANHALNTMDVRDTTLYSLPKELANAQARVQELSLKLNAAQLVADRHDELLKAIPACPWHGENCLVYALKWIREMRAADGDEPEIETVRVRENTPVV